MIATVLDRNRASHAVLVVRTQFGDYVLDNQNRKMLPWRATGYTFLKMQNPNAMNQWSAILSGGLIKDAPTGAYATKVKSAGAAKTTRTKKVAHRKNRRATPLSR